MQDRWVRKIYFKNLTPFAAFRFDQEINVSSYDLVLILLLVFAFSFNECSSQSAFLWANISSEKQTNNPSISTDYWLIWQRFHCFPQLVY